jgi:osmoprotectant transport system substrate-binding protein
VRPRWSTPLVAAALCLLALSGCGGNGNGESEAPARPRPPVTIGTKNFPEQFVLGELYAQALRGRGYRVVLKEDIGATEIIHRALERGTLDMYPEYVGVLVTEVARQDKPASARQAYVEAKAYEEKRGYTLLDPTPFQNRDAIAVKPSYARRFGLKSIGDLQKVDGSVTIGAPPEFRTRFEGFVGLEELYGLRNIRFRPVPIAERYEALEGGRVDAVDVFTTDGELESSPSVVLSDPENLFGFQNVAPIVSKKALDAQGAGFARVVNGVSSRLTTEDMRSMNAAVLGGEAAAKVADAFLRRHGLK